MTKMEIAKKRMEYLSLKTRMDHRARATEAKNKRGQRDDNRTK